MITFIRRMSIACFMLLCGFVFGEPTEEAAGEVVVEVVPAKTVDCSLEQNERILEVTSNGSAYYAIVLRQTEGLISTINDYFLIMDGKRIGPFAAISPPIMSQNGKAIAFTASTDEGWFVFNGFEKAGPYEFVSSLQFSQDGKIFVYAALINDKWHIVNGKSKSGPFENANIVQMSPDGSALLYTYQIGDKWFAFAGAEKIGPFDSNQFNVVFSPDWKTVAYAKNTDKEWFVYKGKEKIGPYEEVDGATILFQKDGKKLVYSAKTDGKWYLYAGKEKAGPYEEIANVVFSPDYSKLAYAAASNGKWFVYYGKTKQGPYEIVGKPFITPAHGKLTYKTREEGKLYVYFDGERKGPFGDITENDFRLNHYVQTINVSPDEKTIAFLAILDNDTFLIRDDEMLGPYENASWFTFSPDGKSYAFAVSDNGNWHLVSGKKDDHPYNWVGQVELSRDGSIVSYWCEEDDVSLHVIRIAGEYFPGSFIVTNGVAAGYIIARGSKIEIYKQ